MQITAAVEGKLHQYLWHEYQWWMCLARINKSQPAAPKWSIFKMFTLTIAFSLHSTCPARLSGNLFWWKEDVIRFSMKPGRQMGHSPQPMGESHRRLLTCDISASSRFGCTTSPSIRHIPKIHHFLEWHFHVGQQRQTPCSLSLTLTRITREEDSLVHHYRPQRPYLNVPVSCWVITPRV